MKRSPKLSLCLLCLAAPLRPAPASAQAIPAGVGSVPNLGYGTEPLSGSFNYSLNAAELISTGFFNTSGTVYTTNLGGDAVYQSKGDVHPFSLIYTGGVLLQNSGQPTTTYQSLSLSQSLRTKNWNFNIQDAVSYLPESPVGGLSGIPGVGDLGIDPVPVGPEAGIGILTTYGPRVSNTVTGSASRLITSHLSAEVTGYEEQQHFIGDNAGEAVDNSGEGGSAGLTYRFDARNTGSVSYDYSRFTYPGFGVLDGALISQGATVSYTRQWNRRFSTNVYIGPQIESSGNGLFSSTTEVAGGATAAFQSRTTFYTLSYNRSANNGSGVIPGSFASNVNAGASRIFARVWNVAGDVGYSRVSSIPGIQTFTFSSQGVTASGQVSRALTHRLYGYASYTVEQQSLGTITTIVPNAFNGTYQIVGIGVSYSPRRFLFGK